MEHAREDALDFSDVRLVAAIQDAMNLARNGFHLRRQNLGHVLRCQQTSFAIRTASRKNCYKPKKDRAKAQLLATCSRRTRTASSTHTSSSLHPFEHRSAVTPIRGGLQLRGSKWHRQLKTAKTPRNQTKSQGGGNLYRKKSRQGCPRDFAHPRGRIFRLLRAYLVPSKPKALEIFRSSLRPL